MTLTEVYRVIQKLNIVKCANHLYFDHVDFTKTEIGHYGKDFAGNYGIKVKDSKWVHDEFSAERVLQNAIVKLKEKQHKKELEKIKGDFV